MEQVWGGTRAGVWAGNVSTVPAGHPSGGEIRGRYLRLEFRRGSRAGVGGDGSTRSDGLMVTLHAPIVNRKSKWRGGKSYTEPRRSFRECPAEGGNRGPKSAGALLRVKLQVSDRANSPGSGHLLLFLPCQAAGRRWDPKAAHVD